MTNDESKMTKQIRITNGARAGFGAVHRAKDSCKYSFGLGGTLALTPALSHRMGEGESSSFGRRIQPLWKLRETGVAVPSPVGRERVRVRDVLFETRLLSDTCFCTNPKVGGG